MKSVRNRVVYSRIRIATVCWLLLLAVCLSACATDGLKKDIQAFSEGVTLTTTNTAAAFEIVEGNYYQVRVAQLAADYEKKGFNPNSVTRFLPPEEMNLRLQVLEALQVYADKLSEIMDDKKLEEFDSQTRSFGEGMLKLKDNPAIKEFAPKENGVKIFTAAVDALGHWFIEYRRENGLKRIVQALDSSVQDICKLLIEDIGAVPDSDGKGGHGLRGQLRNQYKELLKAHDSFLENNISKFDPRTKREEIARLPEFVREQQTADATLAATQQAIKKLGETHSELVLSFDAPSPKFKQLVRQLSNDGKRIGQFYKTIGK